MQGLPYVRINPDLGEEPPKLDDKQILKKLRDRVRQLLANPAASMEAQRVAFQLVASTFYYSRSGPLIVPDGTRLYPGTRLF